MSEVLLEAILEKLQSIEITSLKDNNPAKDEAIQSLLKELKSFKSEMAKFLLEFKISNELTSDLLKNINALNFRDNPLPNQIKHRHHLHNDIWISVGLFIFCVFFLYGWLNCQNEKNTFEGNDIKYRYFKVNGNSNLLKATYSTDSLYNLNQDYFVNKVVEKEKYFRDQYELYRIAAEKKKDSTARKVHIGR